MNEMANHEGESSASCAGPIERLLEHYRIKGEMDAWARQLGELAASDPVGAVSAVKLAALDQFHVRGLVATAELAGLLDLSERVRVLDAGSGLGGPSRYLAETFGCRVTGVDLSPSFVALSRLLAKLSPAASRVDYVVCNMSALPFAADCFDVVWTQHALMNVPDRIYAYREFRRVLAPGGRLAFYDVIAADDAPALEFPVPWAPDPSASFLLTAGQTQDALQSAGFIHAEWHDTTAVALNWFAQAAPPTATPLSLAAAMGRDFGIMANNLARNLREGRVRLVMAVWTSSKTLP